MCDAHVSPHEHWWVVSLALFLVGSAPQVQFSQELWGLVQASGYGERCQARYKKKDDGLTMVVRKGDGWDLVHDAGLIL